jgi:hypothetical protein
MYMLHMMALLQLPLQWVVRCWMHAAGPQA